MTPSPTARDEEVLSVPLAMQKFMGCTLYLSRDADLLHLSLSRKDRLPSYEELKSARYQFMPDAEYVVQIFPPQEDFVNIHDFCLHLWEVGEPFIYSELNVDRFRDELSAGRGDQDVSK